MPYSTSVHRDFSYWLFKDRIPVTKLLIISNVLTFALIALANLGVIVQLLAFQWTTFLIKPWSIVTYPLVWVGDPLGLLFSGYWLWVAGGSLERNWGSQKFAIYFFSMCAVTAVGIFIGGWLTHADPTIAGLWLPLAGVTVAFAMLNPEQQILFFMIIPMKLKYLALIDVIIVLFSYGSGGRLLLGIFALAGCAMSYFYVKGRSSFSRYEYRSPQQDTHDRIIRIYPQRRTFTLNPFKWYKEYKDRKRLKDFFDR